MASLAPCALVRPQRRRAVSAPVLLGLVRAADFALLLAAAWLAALFAARGFEASAWYEPPLRGALALAAVLGAAACSAVLEAQGAYGVGCRGAPQTPLAPLLRAVPTGAAAVIVCLFLADGGAPPPRAFPFAFAAAALALLAALRLGLRAAIARWTRAGCFRRRVAVVAVSEFSAEFIARLAAEPDAFAIAGVYDDRCRSGRAPAAHAGVAVRGSVADLVRDSRDETVDIIAVALPLAAVDRIAAILEALSSTVADVCLTTDVAGLAYRGDRFGAVGGNPVIAAGENPLKDWRAVRKACSTAAPRRSPSSCSRRCSSRWRWSSGSTAPARSCSGSRASASTTACSSATSSAPCAPT